MFKKYVNFQSSSCRLRLTPKKHFSSSAGAVTDSKKPSLRFAQPKPKPPPTDTIIPLCFFPKSSLKYTNPWDYKNLFKKNIPYSRYKMNLVMMAIRKKNIYDAYKLCQIMPSKGFSIIKGEIEKFIKQKATENENYLDNQYIIEEAFVGGRLGPPKVDIRGRSKLGTINKPYCHVTLRLKKIPMHRIFSNAILGKVETPLADIIKNYLMTSKADYAAMKDWSFITSSRSRHYRKTQLRRFVQTIRQYLKSKGMVISYKYIEDRVHDYIINKKMFKIPDMNTLYSHHNVMHRLDKFEKTFQKV